MAGTDLAASNSSDVRHRVVLAVALVALLLIPGPARAGAALSFHSADGLRIVKAAQIDARQYDVAVSTPALGRSVDVRILIPSNYFQTSARLPVLYLFHGTSGRASDWVQMGHAEQVTAGYPLIVVMPDAGFEGNGGGWFTNWVDTKTALGPSQWESFHIAQLIPWVDANLRTIAARRGRAIAGLSQGGFGSTTYAARHPDLFSSAASFSGAPDIDWNPTVAAGATAIIDATEIGLDGVEPDAMFGSRVTDEINWQGHDPADLVDNLRPVDLWLYTATGQPGPYDSGPPNPGASGIEAATHASTEGFVQRAQQQGVPLHLVDYVYGTHTWPYWTRDLAQYLPHLMTTVGHPASHPGPTTYLSIDQAWSQWGWSVSLHRAAAQQFSALTGAGPGGFTLQGTGTAEVTTPGFYRPGSAARVSIGRGPAESVHADTHGRLELVVPLSPAIPTTAVVGVPSVPGAPVIVTISDD